MTFLAVTATEWAHMPWPARRKWQTAATRERARIAALRAAARRHRALIAADRHRATAAQIRAEAEALLARITPDEPAVIAARRAALVREVYRTDRRTK